jgi:hypothetical protein
MKKKIKKIMESEKGESAILLVIEIALAVYIAIVLIRYLIIPALVGH